ncbi:FtsX-like permease family protein [Geodermatophilaceae bacterium NBWT11]|nr:FtsX-like permease family protein [Geodermatophilaceae bacterium NBWT11]
MGTRARVAAAPGPWLLSVVVLALAAVLAVLVPSAVAATADDAVRSAVVDAGTAADTVLTVPFTADLESPTARQDDSAAETRALAADVPGALPAGLAAAVAAPVATVRTRQLTLELPAPVAVALGPTTLRLDWLADPAPTWTAGTAPAAAAGEEVQAGLSAPVAAALGVGVGDRLAGRAPNGSLVDVLVTGVFAAADPDDRAWTTTPDLLAPSTRGAGGARQTDVAALLSDTSLPDARLAVGEGDLIRTLTLAARPAGVAADGAERVAAAVTALRAAPVVLGISPVPRVDSRLDAVLLAATDRLAAARAQAAVLVTAVGLATALVLLLGATVLVSRRAGVLAGTRARGGSLPGPGVALLAESAVLTALGLGLGLLVGTLLAPGPVPVGAALAGVVPVALAGLLALPVLGVRAADLATGGRRVPLDRRGRTRAHRERLLRRVAVDGALVLLAVGAVAALRARGLSGGALTVAAPAVAVLAGSVLVARVQPAVAGLLLRGAVRSRGAVPLLAAAGARSTAVLGPLALTAVTALVTVVLALGATASAGQVEASWTAVGADATVTAGSLPELPVAGAGLAVPARVTEGVQLSTPSGSDRTRLVVVDPAAYGELVDSTPLPDVEGLGDLAGDTVLALVTPDLTGATGSVLQDGTSVSFTVVGNLPAGPTTVLLSSAAVPADLAVPNTLWLTGPGAAQAAAEVAAAAPGADVVLRADRLAEVQQAPLTRGLAGLVLGVAGVLLALTVVVVLLSGSAGVRRRRSTSGVLRTLGLGERQARAVSLLELLPGVLATVVPGVALGALVTALVTGPLGLRLVTGQDADPALVVPWTVLALVVPPVLAVVALVVGEARARRRVTLAEVLREG